MIDGSKKCTRQLGYELQNSHVFEMCSNFSCLVLIGIHHEGEGKLSLRLLKDLKGLTGAFYDCGKENKSFIHI